MSIPMTTEQILDREYLEIRAKILELAASFDRLERSDGVIPEDERWQLIQQGIKTLLNDGTKKAEQIQMLFSLDFDENWKKTLGV